MEGDSMSAVYVSNADNRSIAYSPDAFGGECYVAPEPSANIFGRSTFDRELGEWVIDAPYEPSNSEKRKEALSQLSIAHQADIVQLNTAWLAAAVSDGVNETAKKDAVIAQINDRKTKYAADRAAIIAQYPEA